MTLQPGLCFCGANTPFAQCCEPIIGDPSLAQTPEALMRSRYTAFVTENTAHLLATWDPATRPETVDLGSSRVKWLGLQIHAAQIDPLDATRGEVRFSATCIDHDQLTLLRETSHFVRHRGRWYYLDGDSEISLRKVGRNSPCPCGSGRKFKRCCLLP